MTAKSPESVSVIPSRGRAVFVQLGPVATVFVSSACIMVLELGAGRLISRYLGQSLYTWTTIIGVVLAGISVGNHLGGRIADRRSTRGVLALQFLLAGAACSSILATNAWVGEWRFLQGLAWPLRIFIHITIVFLIPAAVLGTISPVIAKRALTRGLATGRTVGNVYAWATAGSIVGTFVTGFYLLMWLGVAAVTLAAAAGLAAVGILYGAGKFFARSEDTGVRVAETKAASRPARLSFREWIEPVGAVFIASACVMIAEVAAGRLISRSYGQSLYTWTTVIGVILTGLSLGSYAGGRLADRFDTAKTLCLLLVLGSISCECVPIINNFFADQLLLIGVSWPVQIATETICEFLVPSLLLGAVTPVVVKGALARGGAAGQTIGNLYAWGTVGSLLGTFLAGYWLIAAIGSLPTVHCVAAVLAVTAVMYNRKGVLPYLWAPVCAAALVLGVSPWEPLSDYGSRLDLRGLPPANAVYIKESQYSYIAVTEDPGQPNIREMVLDKLIHSRVNLEDPRELRYEYEWVYSAVIDKYYPDARPITALVIGGGGYAFPHYLEVTRPGGAFYVAEIDAQVTEAAHAASGLPRDTGIHISNMDARNFVDDLIRDKRAGKSVPRFDCIFGDSINDYSVPYHLTTREFNDRLSELLADDGMYLFNMIDVFNSSQFVGAVINTCRQTFPYVYAFTSYDDPTVRDTFIVIGSKREIDAEGIAETIRAQHAYRGEWLTASRLADIEARAGGRTLTDNFAPVDIMLAPVARLAWRNLPASLINAANEDISRGLYDAALEDARMVLRSGVQTAEAQEIIGSALLQKGGVAEAVKALQESLKADPNRATAYNNLASALYQSGDVPGAMAAWSAAIDKQPDYMAARKNYAFALLAQGRFDEAVAQSQTVIDSREFPAEANEIRGIALLRKEDVDGAIAALRKSVEANPERESAFNNLGHALLKKGDLDGAVAAWETTLRLKPDFAQAKDNIRLVQMKKGAAGSVEDLEKAVEANPQSASAHGNLAAALLKQSDAAGAVRELEAVLKLEPEYPSAHHLLAVAYWKLKDFDRAWAEVKKVRELGRPVEPGLLEALKRDSGRNE